MAHYGKLASYKFAGKDVDDIRGSAVYGLKDDKLGKIDDVIFDHMTGDIRYVVVDTGGWLSSKKFLVPADQLKTSSEHDNDYRVDLTKTQVESFPPYDENAVESQDNWNAYENRYRSAWSGTNPAATASTSGVGTRLGQRWSAFETHLRSDRERIVSHCSVCARPGVQRSDVEQKRKVS